MTMMTMPVLTAGETTIIENDRRYQLDGSAEELFVDGKLIRFNYWPLVEFLASGGEHLCTEILKSINWNFKKTEDSIFTPQKTIGIFRSIPEELISRSMSRKRYEGLLSGSLPFGYRVEDLSSVYIND